MKPIVKKSTSAIKLKSAVKKRTTQSKKIALKTVDTELQKVSGLDFPFWLRNKEGKVNFGLKVDQVTFSNNEIRVFGWLVGMLCGIHLKLNGINLASTLSRKERLDVTQSLGIKEPNGGSGFQLTAKLPPSNFNKFKLALIWSVGTQSSEIVLREETPVELSSRSRDKGDNREARYYVDKIEGPCLYGWAEINNRPVKKIAIKANDSIIECTVLKIDRKDVGEELGIEAIDLGFIITIPGYLWETIPFEEDVLIQLMIDGLSIVNGSSVILSRKHIADWIDGLATLPDDCDKQYLSLIALEHIHYGRLSKLLSPSTLRFMHEFAIRMNLSGFVVMSEAKAEKLSLDDSFNNFFLWKALRTLNERLNTENLPNDVFSAVVEVMHDFGLVGEDKNRYICSVIPMLCRYNVFTRLREITDFAPWYDYESADDAWGLTIALPFLLVDHEIERAINTAWKLSKKLEFGWINTECIHFCVKEVGRQLLAGLVTGEQAEKFGYAIIGVYDAFRGEWFSRLHDLELIRSAVAFVDIFDTYTDKFRSVLLKCLIRNYALAPEFWQTLLNTHPEFSNKELVRAHDHWKNLHSALVSGQVLHKNLDQLLQPLSYFRVMDNPEAVIFLREVVMNSLPHLNKKPTSAGIMLIEMMFEAASEGLRLTAFPLVELTWSSKTGHSS